MLPPLSTCCIAPALSYAAVSPDGLRLASVGESDCALKLFDVLSFDMTDMCRLPFAPAATCVSALPLVMMLLLLCRGVRRRGHPASRRPTHLS